MDKKFVFLVFFIFFTLFSAAAGSVSFQIIQRNGKISDVCTAALVMQDEILKYFYDAGFIVTDAPITVSSSDDQDIKLSSLGYTEAASGGFSNFIQIILFINSESGKDFVKKIILGNFDKIYWKIISVNSGNIIEEGSKNIVKPIGRDSEANVREFAKDFACYIEKYIK